MATMDDLELYVEWKSDTAELKKFIKLFPDLVEQRILTTGKMIEASVYVNMGGSRSSDKWYKIPEQFTGGVRGVKYQASAVGEYPANRTGTDNAWGATNPDALRDSVRFNPSKYSRSGTITELQIGTNLDYGAILALKFTEGKVGGRAWLEPATEAAQPAIAQLWAQPWRAR